MGNPAHQPQRPSAQAGGLAFIHSPSSGNAGDSESTVAIEGSTAECLRKPILFDFCHPLVTLVMFGAEKIRVLGGTLGWGFSLHSITES
jgi:hypothetical protein